MTNSEDLPMTEQSAAEILAKLTNANPQLMEETLATLTQEQRDAATKASNQHRGR